MDKKLNNKPGTGVFHFKTGFLTAVGGYRAGSILNEHDFEACSASVQHGCQHANVFRKPTNQQPLDAVFAKFFGQTGLIERRILILVETNPFRHHNG